MTKLSASTKTTMKAIVYHEYGSPDVLQSVEIPIPTPKEDEVLVITLMLGEDWQNMYACLRKNY